MKILILLCIVTLPFQCLASYVFKVPVNTTAYLAINGKKKTIILNPGLNIVRGKLPKYSEGRLIAKNSKNGHAICNVTHLVFLGRVSAKTGIRYKVKQMNLRGDCSSLISRKISRVIVVNQSKLFCQTKIFPQYASFIPQRVFMVDRDNQTGNILFRGNMPLTYSTKQKVDFATLIKTMELKFVKQGTVGKFPPHFNLLDVTLINSRKNSERAALLAELSSFMSLKNKELLNLSHLIIQGKLHYNHKVKFRANVLWWEIQPYLKRETHKQIAFAQLVSKLVYIMKIKAKIPTIIYVHCINGRDRTSMVLSAYLIKKYGLTLSKSYKRATVLISSKGKLIKYLPRDPHKIFINSIKYWHSINH